jgi:hypothetical protein
MTTNLLLGTCQIPLAATAFTASPIAETFFEQVNLFAESLNEITRLATPTTGLTTMNFDLGSGVTKAANFLYIAKANMLQLSGVTQVTLKGNSISDYGTGTAVHDNASFATSSLVGPHGEDYLASFTTSAAFRYWYSGLNSTIATKRPHAKLYFGTSLDLGRDPVSPSFKRVRSTDAQRKSKIVLSLTWQDISYANTVTLIDSVIKPRRTNPVVLYTTSYHAILHGYRALLCEVVSATTPVVLSNQNEVQITFETLI